MKIVKVTYTTRPEFAETNKNNIRNVMADLQRGQYAGILYHVCLGPDGKTFIHTAFFKSEEDQRLLNELPSFKYFQEQVKAGKPEVPPTLEPLTLVGSSRDFF